MKIISKYKDYYDYLSGIYGVDPLVVLDRRDADRILFIDGSIKLTICGICYEGYYKNGIFYWGKDLGKIGTRYIHMGVWYYALGEVPDFHFHNERESIRESSYKDPQKLNYILNCPILYGKYKYPKLIDMGIQKILSAETIYFQLVDFLSRKEITHDTQSDIEKVISHGFDTKTSFRK